MKNIEEIRKRFLRDNSALRLGNLAANLSRIASFSEDCRNNKIVESIIDESKHLIEWAASDFPLDIQSELIELQIKLAVWHLQWTKIFNDNQKISKMRNDVEKASQRFLKLSGIL